MIRLNINFHLFELPLEYCFTASAAQLRNCLRPIRYQVGETETTYLGFDVMCLGFWFEEGSIGINSHYLVSTINTRITSKFSTLKSLSKFAWLSFQN